MAWSSALELGLRLIAVAQALPGLAGTAAFKVHGDTVLTFLDRHCRWLCADLSLDKVVRGNHLLGELARPIMQPVQKVIPPIGGFDLSPIFAIILLGAIPLLLQDIIRLFM